MGNYIMVKKSVFVADLFREHPISLWQMQGTLEHNVKSSTLSRGLGGGELSEAT